MKRLAIIGSGDLGQLIAYHAHHDKQYEVAGFFDDFRAVDELVGPYPVLGGINETIFSKYESKQFDELAVAIGYKHFSRRKSVFDQFHAKIPFGTIIHSSAYIDPSCTVMEGSVILPGCILDRNVVIEQNVLLNTGCIIAHDTRVKKHSFLSPAVAVAGFVTIGSCCNIGINTTVIDNITIADDIQTGGGTVVIRNLSQKGLYVGNPARFIK